MINTKYGYRMILLVVISITFFSFDLPTGWHKSGNAPDKYDMGIDKGVGQNGKNAGTIRSIDKNINGFGTLMQNSMPGKFLGKRIRMSGFLKTKDVSEWAGFWLRIDGKNKDGHFGFDNMHDDKTDRSVKGTTEWTKYEIVLNVSEDASNIAYGALLSGTGQVWFDDLKIEIVDESIPVTGIELGGNKPQDITQYKEPTNLELEK